MVLNSRTFPSYNVLLLPSVPVAAFCGRLKPWKLIFELSFYLHAGLVDWFVLNDTVINWYVHCMVKRSWWVCLTFRPFQPCCVLR